MAGGKAICLKEDVGSCGGGVAACLLYKVKERWVESGIPVFDNDSHCLRAVTNLKNSFDKKKRNKKISIEDKTAFIKKLSSTTLCLLPEDWERRIKAEAFLTGGQNRERINAVLDYIGIAATRSAIIEPESEYIKRGRRAWNNEEVQGGELDHNEDVGTREEGESEEHMETGELEPGEIVDTENNSQQDKELGHTSQSEGTVGVDSQESSGVEQERRYAKTVRRQRLDKRKRKELDGDDSNGDSDSDYVEARVPRDLLKKLSLLSVNLGLSVRQQLSMTMATYELIGIDPCEMELSVSSCLRYRHQATHAIADERMLDIATQVKEADGKIFVHYDTKQIEEDLDGVRQVTERLVVSVSSPVLERPALLCAFPLESGTGEAMADAVWTILTSPGLQLQDCVAGIVADTTASNFGQYRGSITILQGYFGYPILVIPCQHHTHKLPAKHVTRLVSGRKTTGVGETIFLKYKASYNEIKKHLKTDPVPLKKFDWEKYRGTPVEAVARRVLAWAEAALEQNQFARGHYKYAVQLVFIYLGGELPNFVLLRPTDTSPARFLAHGIFYLEITLSMNCHIVYELYTGREREEMILMSMYASCYYLPNMVQSKYPAQITSLTNFLVCDLEDLKQVHHDIAVCALEVVRRHLEPVSGELAILGIVDLTLSEEERQEAGQVLWHLGENWEPGHLEIQAVQPPAIVLQYQVTFF